jgi:hypothetical protein
MSYYEKLKSDIRDLKLSTILGENGNENALDFSPDLKKLRKGNNRFFDQPYWKVIKEWKGKSVITGSAALYAFGLLDRMPQDIDLLVDKNNFNPNIKLSKNRYSGMDSKMNILGYYIDKKSNMNVDFFHSESHEVIEVDGFLFHHPFEIMFKKIEISLNREKNNSKDIRDLIHILRILKPGYEI